MRADPQRCTADADEGFDHYLWAFRDNTLAYGSEETARELTHRYAKTKAEDALSVRVQVQDAEGMLVYGDSPYIHFKPPASESLP